MAKVERFEDLEAWQRARVLARAVYAASGQGRFARDWGLAGQVQRSGVSVMSNIAEGFERFRPAEFHHFLSVAKGSCAELRSQLYLARDLGYIDEGTFNSLMNDARDVASLLGALLTAVSRRLDVAKERPPTTLSTQHAARSTRDGG